MNKTIRAFLCVLLGLSLFVLSGCGAVLSTKMTIDKNFNGTREIFVKIDNGDLSYVEGGLAALETVIQNHIPKEMTYSMTADDSSSTFCFVISYSGLEDYRAKVEKIIAAGELDLEPTVVYEKEDSYFKTGIAYQENFTSADLLQWYFNALQEANIISQSSSDWYELGTDTLILEDQEYSGMPHRFEIDEQVFRCLDKIEVETVLKTDGTIERTIAMTASKSVKEELAKVGCQLDSYLQALCPEGDSFIAEEDGEYSGKTRYQFTLTADSAEAITEKTNRILQTENALRIELAVREEEPGVADVKVTESLDGSFYLNSTDGYYYQNKLTSAIKVYDNITLAEDANFSYSFTDDGTIRYYPKDGEEYSFNCVWKIGFQSVDLKASASNAEKLALTFVFTDAEGLRDEVKASARTALEQAAIAAGGNFSAGDTSCTVTFSGPIAEVEQQVNAMISSYVPKEEKEEGTGTRYFSVTLKEFDTSSKFTGGMTGEIYYDLAPMLGQASLRLIHENGLFHDVYYVCPQSSEEDGVLIAPVRASVTFYDVRVSAVSVVLLIVFALLLLAGIVCTVVFRKEFAKFGARFASAKKPAAPAAAQPSTPQTQPPLASAPEAPPAALQPTQENAETDSEKEEDELL